MRCTTNMNNIESNTRVIICDMDNPARRSAVKFLGFSDTSKKLGSSGPVFSNLKEVKKHYKVVKNHELENDIVDDKKNGIFGLFVDAVTNQEFTACLRDGKWWFMNSYPIKFIRTF